MVVAVASDEAKQPLTEPETSGCAVAKLRDVVGIKHQHGRPNPGGCRDSPVRAGRLRVKSRRLAAYRPWPASPSCAAGSLLWRQARPLASPVHPHVFRASE